MTTYSRLRGRFTRPRIVFSIVSATLVVAFMAWSPGDRPAQAATTITPVTLEGEGTADVTAELSSWQNDVSADTDNNVTVDYYDNNGDALARQDFIAGEDDYIISGVPFQASELAQIPGGSSSIIAAPVMPSGLGFLFNPPDGGFYVDKVDGEQIQYGPDDGNTVPVVAGQTLSGCPTAGCPPVNVPATNLAAMVKGDANYVTVNGQQEQLDYWGDPEILSTWDQTALDFDEAAGDQFSPAANDGAPVTYLLQEPDADNYYLQEYFSTVAPSEWTYSGPITESLPEALADADPTQLGLSILLGDKGFQSDLNPRAGQAPGGGTITPAPPSAPTLVDQSEDTTAANVASGQGSAPTYYAVPEFLGIQNANGDWVTPSPGSIEAGVDAGAAAGENACSTTNTNAMYGLTSKVPGAYPITWVDCLYAPTSGLSIAKADAIAGLIRYLVTDGQSYLEPNGDGKLPVAYVEQSLAAANEVVADNCPGAGGVLTLTAKPTAWTPTSAGVTALGAVDECETPAAAAAITTPTTTVPVSAGTSAANSGETFPSSSFASSGDDLGSSDATAVTAAPVTTPATSPTTTPAPVKSSKHVITASIAANLPEPLSTTFDSSFDKLSALLVGGLFFLAARRVFRWATKASGR